MCLKNVAARRTNDGNNHLHSRTCSDWLSTSFKDKLKKKIKTQFKKKKSVNWIPKRFGVFSNQR